ncbi:acyl-CoA-binding domain-containing protein 1 isoform X3 [Triticum aestivum]|uniref:acyl-CoA-binding domain-containing protein 1 isoform X3 n=1 Tax=Triticum aestivum TaxID=4565 RepID=UPI001D00C94E|nr:acyl-CoA-binding domain-containing protein 1-like isoform X3 [Triticum aestivum]
MDSFFFLNAILYGLFKQATVGVANTARPGMFNMRERAKWDAWEAVKDKSKEAMNDYTTKVKQLQEEAAAAGSYSQRRTLCAILL